MNIWLKTVLSLCTVLSATSTWGACYAQDGPIFQNSQQGQTSSLNWQNSPEKWQNSPQNYNSTNGIYDTAGNRTGYAIRRPDGSGTNFFNNDGARTGQKIF